MASQSDAGRLVSANHGISELATASLDDLWSSLDVTRPESAVAILLDEAPVLVDQFGDVSAVVAADWYDDMRANSGARGRFVAIPAGSVAAEQVQAQVRFGAQHLFGGNPAQALAFLAAAVSRYVLQPGRETIAVSAQRDPSRPKLGRVVSATACDYCRGLAASGDAHKFHGHCGCAPAPTWH